VEIRRLETAKINPLLYRGNFSQAIGGWLLRYYRNELAAVVFFTVCLGSPQIGYWRSKWK
jgi:hypothetical protein